MNIQRVDEFNDGSEIGRTDADNLTNASRSSRASSIDQTVSNVTRPIFISLAIHKPGNPHHIGYGQLMDGSFCKGLPDTIYLVTQNHLFTEQREKYELFMDGQKLAHFHYAKQPDKCAVAIPICSVETLLSCFRP